jgi:hypothetical protein
MALMRAICSAENRLFAAELANFYLRLCNYQITHLSQELHTMRPVCIVLLINPDIFTCASLLQSSA